MVGPTTGPTTVSQTADAHTARWGSRNRCATRGRLSIAGLLDCATAAHSCRDAEPVRCATRLRNPARGAIAQPWSAHEPRPRPRAGPLPERDPWSGPAVTNLVGATR